MASTQTHSTRRSSRRSMPKSMTAKKKAARKKSVGKVAKRASSISIKTHKTTKHAGGRKRSTPLREFLAKGPKTREIQREITIDREADMARRARGGERAVGGREAESNDIRRAGRGTENEVNRVMKGRRRSPHFSPGMKTPGARRH